MSRQISYDAANAFESGQTFSRSNTCVEERTFWYTKGPFVALVLHGNPIARYPVGTSFRTHGEISHCGWGHSQVTQDRINALSGVHLSNHKGETWIKVGRLYFPCPSDWVDFRTGPEPTKASRRETKARTAVNEWIANHHAGQPAGVGIAQRGHEPILVDTVTLPAFGHPATVVWRPWDRAPAGEVKVDGYPRICFKWWKDFDAAIATADEITSPDLYKLAIAARDIIS